MTYNVFSGTLNPTQSINQLMWTKFLVYTNNIPNVEFNSVVGGRTSYMQLTGSWFNYNYAHSYYIQSEVSRV